MTLHPLDETALDGFDRGTAAPSPVGYDRISMAFHWVTLLLIVALLWSAWTREGVENGTNAGRLLMLHRSIGLLVWIVTLLRILWRGLFGAAPSLPPAVSTAHHVAARASQLGLYGLLILQPITGFLQSIWRGRPFALFGLPFPAIAPRDKDLSHLFHGLHEVGATAFLIVIGLHALAALFHGFVRRDGVLETMLPIRRSAPTRTSADADPDGRFDAALD
jgi:cytochrome b561